MNGPTHPQALFSSKPLHRTTRFPRFHYLVGYSREAPEEEDRLEAIRMAAEAWLVERAIFSV